jgi:hypothetical protein
MACGSSPVRVSFTMAWAVASGEGKNQAELNMEITVHSSSDTAITIASVTPGY